MILRDYQRKALEAIHGEIEEHQRTLLVMATGLGKTAVRGRQRACVIIKIREVVLKVHFQVANFLPFRVKGQERFLAVRLPARGGSQPFVR